MNKPFVFAWIHFNPLWTCFAECWHINLAIKKTFIITSQLFLHISFSIVYWILHDLNFEYIHTNRVTFETNAISITSSIHAQNVILSVTPIYFTQQSLTNICSMTASSYDTLWSTAKLFQNLYMREDNYLITQIIGKLNSSCKNTKAFYFSVPKM